ncbi:hypothetical protein [Methylobacterium sp. WL64]|uniref:hypothetical protein n=1 Tax=Methylobacterium sp. WL64 TaxID=2603894 RepID=UPI0016506B90|nr:hypothetical protein [Methylobacterium sp. WL64]
MPLLPASTAALVLTRLLSRDGLHGSYDILQLGDLAERTPGRQSVMLGHRQNERTLVRLQAFEEGFELGEHEKAVAATGGPNNLDSNDGCAHLVMMLHRAVCLFASVAITVLVSACNQGGPPDPRPVDQIAFQHIIDDARSRYENAKNGWVKEPVREEREKTLCENTKPKFEGWIGKVNEISKTSKGDALFEIEIAKNTWLSANPDAFLIRKNHPFFPIMITLGVGDRVRIWGDLVRATGNTQSNMRIDCYREDSILESGTMIRPEFLFILDAIEKI